ncbi:hypothetical protein M0R88_15295 [Halorussus gelatinilyticus]|uniref:Uncharacterized protein n=1 Tax=Halorussus gelatinilyticus TaxID=2937524 RepID=A0A8U0IHY5_9EURY|nr:hypothetical protein [Halorussus gelatinilyticus]UPV99871.1 hypothetical protein M0R88_15295 [Halorussus gelatinilyticus]
MSLAEETRAAARRRPFLVDALRAGVVNYTAAARELAEEMDGDPDNDSVATALRRFADSLPDRDADSRSARVSMKSGLGEVEASADAADALLAVGDTRLAPGEGSLTGVLASGDVAATALGHVLGRLDAEGVAVRAAGLAGESLLVAVERRDGPDALRVVEDALDAVPGE